MCALFEGVVAVCGWLAEDEDGVDFFESSGCVFLAGLSCFGDELLRLSSFMRGGEDVAARGAALSGF